MSGRKFYLPVIAFVFSGGLTVIHTFDEECRTSDEALFFAVRACGSDNPDAPDAPKIDAVAAAVEGKQ